MRGLRAEVIGNVVDALGPRAREHGTVLEVAGLDWAKVTGQRDDLVQVLQKLVDNAIKYGGGPIRGHPLWSS